MLQTGLPEVDQQRALSTSGLQVVDYLRLFIPGYAFNSLDLDNDLVVADEVGSVRARQRLPLVTNVDPALLLTGNIAGLEFQSHGFLVDSLQEARPQDSVHFHGSTENRVCLRVPAFLQNNLRQSAKSAVASSRFRQPR